MGVLRLALFPFGGLRTASSCRALFHRYLREAVTHQSEKVPSQTTQYGHRPRSSVGMSPHNWSESEPNDNKTPLDCLGSTDLNNGGLRSGTGKSLD